MRFSDLLRFPPKSFQKEGIREALKYNYFMVADDMGLGKTFQAIAVQRFLRLRTLVISPSYLKWNWQSEFLHLSKNPPSLIVMASKKDIEKYNGEEVAISSYGQLSNLKSIFPLFDLLILDEVQYVKKPTAKRTKKIRKLLKDHPPKRYLGLTGTPMNKVQDLFNLWYLDSFGVCGARPITDIFPKEFNFLLKFSNKKEKYYYKKNKKTGKPERKKAIEFEGIRNEEDLKKLMKGRMIRRKSEDVLDLPPLVEIDINIQESKKRNEKLKKVWELHQAKKEFSDEETEHISTRKAEAAFYMASYTASLAEDMLQQDPTPIIIFSDHIAPIIQLAHDLGKNYSVAVITGSKESKERNEIVKEFQEGKYDYLLATIESAGTGNNLTASNRIIFNDPNWDPEKNRQAKMRIQRINQEKRGFIYHMVGGPVDKKITEIVQKTQSTIDRAIN